MARTTPRVRDGILQAGDSGGRPALPVGAPEWFDWLADAAVFAFGGPPGVFTARQEPVGHGRGGRYWRAYRKAGGRLHRVYIGRSEDLSLDRLEAAAATLAARAAGTKPAMPLAAGSGEALPAPLTPFIGRAGEVATVRRLLAGAPLLTLTGAGGVGKTRLAIEVAGRAREAYPDGVWLVELAPLVDPVLVPQAVARALGLQEQPGQAPLTALRAWLRARRCLLVLDNCEHLLVACAELCAALLPACQTLHILTTSREPLGMAGETVWRVPSLSLPDPDDPDAGDPDRLAQAEAAQLFCDRARAAVSDFRITAANASDIAQLCVRLDGIPLALELAAARIAVLPISELVARLDDRFRLLTTGNRVAMPRQQTLRATLDWSHALLDLAERAVFRRLAVFAGGFVLPAAEAVCADAAIPCEAVVEVLLRLAAKSLVQVEARPSGEARYRLLETMRAYAAERLAEAGEARDVCRRHATWCLDLAGRAEGELRSVDQLTWLARLTVEHDNLRAALGWLLANESELAIRLAGRLRRFWHYRGHYAEGLGWVARLWAAVDAAPALAGTADWATVLLGASRFVLDQGDANRAMALMRESLAIGRAVGDRRAVAATLRELGRLTYSMEDGLAASRAFLEEALAIYRAEGEPHGISYVLMTLGNHAGLEGRVDEARAWLAESRRLADRVGDRWIMSLATGFTGLFLHAIGDYPGAEAALSTAQAIAAELGTSWQVATYWKMLGRVALDRGDLAAAQACGEACLALARAGEQRGHIADAQAILGRVALARAEYERARALLEASLEYGGQTGAFSVLAEAEHALGLVAWRQGQVATAATHLRRGLMARWRRRESAGIAASLEGLALVAAGTGEPARAARWLGAAGRLRETVSAPCPPIDRPALDQLVEALRTTLGEDAFAAAWATGRAQPPDRAVADALATSPSPAPTAEPAGGMPRPLGDGLSAREREVAGHIAAGLTNRQIAAALSISIRTVDRHVANALSKLDVTTRSQIATWVTAHER